MSIFKKAENIVNSAAISLMTAAPEKPQSKRCKRAKKILSTAVTAAIVSTLCAVTAFAEGGIPSFFTDGINILKVVVILIGAGVAVWGIINLLEGYGNDNPGAKSQGMKQLMAGLGVALVGIFLVPKLADLMTEQAGG